VKNERGSAGAVGDGDAGFLSPPSSGVDIKYTTGPESSAIRPALQSHDALLSPARADLRRFLEERAFATRGTPSFSAFFDALDAPELPRFERLWTAIRLLDEDLPIDAAEEADALVRSLPDDDDDDGAVVARVFAEALLGRINNESGSGGNLYLDARPPGAQLRAFELLRLRTPLIPFCYAAANRALLDAIDQPSDVTLLDVGIGRGGQVRALLKNPWARRLIRSLHVIGVEPDSAPGARGALQMAEANVLEAAKVAGIPTTFAGIGKLAEHLTAEDLAAARPRGVLLANCSLSLHHVGLPEHGAARGRTDVLRTIHEAGFSRIVLIEPDTNHDEDELALRFLYAYRHYGTLARSLHAMLTAEDAHLVWREFFTDEIRNVIAHDGALRVERHEETARWLERLESLGWEADTPDELVAPSAAPPGFEVVHTGRACTLCYDGVSLLGVVRARRS
jgi:hypothetical protein